MKQENLTARSGIPSLQGGEDVNEDLMAELAEVDVRLTGKRAEIAGSPLGRYRAGWAAATADLSRGRPGGLLGMDPDQVREVLAGMDPDDALSIVTAAEELTRVGWGVVRGAR